MASEGYFGKLLRVDLTSGTIEETPIDPQIARDYVGGAGLATRLIYDEINPSADPLGPENKLLFTVGPLTGTNYPTATGFQIATKSPLTNALVDSSSTGSWGAALRKAGYDGIIIEGRADKPVWLWINNDRAEIRDASQLWGKDAAEVRGTIKEEIHERRASVVCTGRAGENQVLLASVIDDEGRAAGRGGVGAVMGSKNLKAIAVRGTKTVPVPDDAAWRQHVRAANTATAMLGMGSLGKFGTAGNMDTGWVPGYIPVRNWHFGLWKEGCINLGGKRLADTIIQPRTDGIESCPGCPIKCSRWATVEQGPFAMDGPAPEYEALAAFGTMCMNDNLESVCAANDLCNRYGLDPISTGAALAFAFDAYENRIISRADAGGLDLTWGNAEAILEVTRQMGEATGIGKLLGQGVKRAAAELGKGSESFAVHVKGMEVPPYDPRAYFSIAVSYATAPGGACHRHGNPSVYETGQINPLAGIFRRQGRFDRKGKGAAARVAQEMATLVNSIGTCFLASTTRQPTQFADSLALSTGIPYTGAQVYKAGERIVNLQRMFNLRCGLDPVEDKLPPRLLEPTSDGGHAGKMPFLKEGVEEYYQVRGWTPDGRPTPEKLRELGLDFALEHL